MSAFIVERTWPGVTTADTENKLGVWAGSTGELFFENVEVPAENLLGEEGQGFEIAMHSLDQGRFTVAAGALGVIRACLERCTAYARERETFGQEIGRYQLVQDMIAKMVLGYETSKLLVLQAAWMKDQGKRNTRETSLAKWHATESAFEAAHMAIQVFGSYGYSAEYGIERYFRNARAPIIYEGTTQIHKMLQAEHALGYRRLNGHTGEMSPIVSWGPALLAVTPARRPRRPSSRPRRRAGRARCRRPAVEDPDLVAVGVDGDRRPRLVREDHDPDDAVACGSRPGARPPALPESRPCLRARARARPPARAASACPRPRSATPRSPIRSGRGRSARPARARRASPRAGSRRASLRASPRASGIPPARHAPRRASPS